MKYDAVILEMLSRIKALETQVSMLCQMNGLATTITEGEDKMQDEELSSVKVTTADIRDYIEKAKQNARNKGDSTISLIARDISHDLDLRKRYPMICNAMKQCMNSEDEILFAPASGYSSTLEIKYHF